MAHPLQLPDDVDPIRVRIGGISYDLEPGDTFEAHSTTARDRLLARGAVPATVKRTPKKKAKPKGDSARSEEE